MLSFETKGWSADCTRTAIIVWFIHISSRVTEQNKCFTLYIACNKNGNKRKRKREREREHGWAEPHWLFPLPMLIKLQRKWVLPLVYLPSWLESVSTWFIQRSVNRMRSFIKTPMLQQSMESQLVVSLYTRSCLAGLLFFFLEFGDILCIRIF